MSDRPKIEVHIKFGEIEQKFYAEPQEAWPLISQFLENSVPSFEIAQKLWLNIDLQQLSRDLSGLVAFSNDGVNLLVARNRLTDNEALSVWLTAYHLGNQLGVLKSNCLSKDDLQVKLGKSGKIISTRLGELAKIGIVQKTSDEKYHITTYGVVETQREIIPRIRSKIKI